MTRQQLLTSLEAIAITLRDWIGTGNAPPQAAFAEQHVRGKSVV